MLQKYGIFLVAITFAAHSLFAVNLYSNSGFESSPSGWSVWANADSGAAATGSLDTAGAMFGTKYLKVTVTKVSHDPVANNWVIQLQDPTWQAKKDVEYTFSGWAKADSAGRSIHVAAVGDSASQYTYKTGVDVSLSTDWVFFSHSYVSTVTGSGSKGMNFFIFCGYSTGSYCFDSMALDSATPIQVKNPMLLVNRHQTSNYTVQLTSDCMRFVLGNMPLTFNNVNIYSLEGRLISSYAIPSAAPSFEIPRPAPGAWVVGVNSHKRVIRIP
jgi:hypothetical protein